MSNSIIETIEGEATNLALHVQLCEQRYLQLLTKLDQVDDSLKQMHVIINEIRENLDTQGSARLRTYLTWAGVIITSLLGAVMHLITR